MVRRRRGAQAIEFALVLPVFIGLISGIVDFGWFFHQQSMVNTIVRDSGRRGSLQDVANAGAVARTNACTELANNRLSAGGANCSEVTVTVTGAAPDASLSVVASTNFAPLFGLVPAPGRLGSNLTLHIEGE